MSEQSVLLDRSFASTNEVASDEFRPRPGASRVVLFTHATQSGELSIQMRDLGEAVGGSAPAYYEVATRTISAQGSAEPGGAGVGDFVVIDASFPLRVVFTPDAATAGTVRCIAKDCGYGGTAS